MEPASETGYRDLLRLEPDGVLEWLSAYAHAGYALVGEYRTFIFGRRGGVHICHAWIAYSCTTCIERLDAMLILSIISKVNSPVPLKGLMTGFWTGPHLVKDRAAMNADLKFFLCGLSTVSRMSTCWRWNDVFDLFQWPAMLGWCGWLGRKSSRPDHVKHNMQFIDGMYQYPLL
jgi:hypothetical protein